MTGVTDNLNFLVLEMSRLIRAGFEERVTEAGLGVTASEARLLAHLRHVGPMRQIDLAERLGVGQMSVCGFVDRLESAGLVTRTADPEDRRAKRVSLAATSGPVLRQIEAIGATLRENARGDMTDDEWRTLITLTRRARDNLANVRSSRCAKTAGETA